MILVTLSSNVNLYIERHQILNKEKKMLYTRKRPKLTPPIALYQPKAEEN